MHPQLEKKAAFQRLVRPWGEAAAWTAFPQHTAHPTLGAPAGISGGPCYAQRQALSRWSVCESEISSDRAGRQQDFAYSCSRALTLRAPGPI